MKANRIKMKELMKNYCNDNYNKFARELEIDPSHLYRYLMSGVGGGKKLIGSLMKFCQKNGLSYDDYIEL